MIIKEVIKTAVPALSPVIGLAQAGIAVSQATTPVGGLIVAAEVVATECVFPMVWVSGKCFVAAGLYCWGAATCNPYLFGAAG